MSVLDFAGYKLDGETVYGDGPGGFTLEAVAEGSTFDNPQPIDREIASGLLDGSFVKRDGFGNRKPSFQVVIKAPTSDLIAQGERALALAGAQQLVELGYTPPDGWGARTVFLAWVTDLNWAFDDMDELHLRRAYVLTFTCQPFGLSEDEVVDTFTLASGTTSGTTVVLADGTSTTGWSSPDSTIATSGGALRFTATSAPVLSYTEYESHNTLVRTFTTPEDFTGTPYLTVDLQGPTYVGNGLSYADVFTAFADGAKLPLVAAAPSSTNPGYTRCTFVCGDTSVTEIRIVTRYVFQSPYSAGYTQLDNMVRSSVPPNTASTTGREGLRTVNVKGSARSTGSLIVSHDTQALGKVLAYTAPPLGVRGYSPALRAFLDTSSGTNTADAESVSGTVSAWPNGGDFFCNIPAGLLPPGPYLLMAHLLLTAAGGATYKALTISSQTMVGSAAFLNPQTYTASVPNREGASTVRALLPLGFWDFPTKSVGSAVSSAVEQITVHSNDAGSPSVRIDELWAFWMGEGASLTQADLGTGTPDPGSACNHLFLDAPSVANGGTRQMYAGTQPDRSDSLDWQGDASSWGEHLLSPGPATAFVVTNGASNSTVRFAHRPAWMHNAVRLDLGIAG